MIQKIRQWLFAEHWRTWIGHAMFALLWTALAEGLDSISGMNVRPTAATMVRGYYLIDTISDVVQHPERDPWYDHVMDTATPWIATIVLERMFDDKNNDTKRISVDGNVSMAFMGKTFTCGFQYRMGNVVDFLFENTCHRFPPLQSIYFYGQRRSR